MRQKRQLTSIRYDQFAWIILAKLYKTAWKISLWKASMRFTRVCREYWPIQYKDCSPELGIWDSAQPPAHSDLPETIHTTVKIVTAYSKADVQVQV